MLRPILATVSKYGDAPILPKHVPPSHLGLPVNLSSPNNIYAMVRLKPLITQISKNWNIYYSYKWLQKVPPQIN